MKINNLYIHFPFCKQICTYCDFFKIHANSDLMDKYIIYLKQEIKDTFCWLDLKTIYIGGGTPSLLPPSYLYSILKQLEPCTRDNCEISIEANPESVSVELLRCLNQFNISRISLGVQTTNLKILKLLNRHHDMDDVAQAVKLIRAHTNAQINFDFIYNLPLQKTQDLDNDFHLIKQLKPDHLSYYSLILQPHTPLYLVIKKLNLKKEGEFFEYLNQLVANSNYHQYEISNYAKSTQNQCQHNKAIWKSETYLGIGPSAVGLVKINNQFYLRTNSKSITNPWEAKLEKIKKKDWYFQNLMMGLRLKGGLNLNNLQHYETFLYFYSKINKLIKTKKLIITNNHLKVVDNYFHFLNNILLQF